MEKLIVSTYPSWAKILREHNKLPAYMSDDQVMSWVYHSFLKQPPENITEVKRSSLLSDCSPSIMQALNEFEHDALCGNLKKYVTKEAKRLGGKHDELLYRSAIWHFHILPEAERSIHTSKHLVFAYTWRKVLYLLEIGTHQRGEFRRDRHYLDLISREWPEVLPLDEIEIKTPPLGGGVEPTHESSLIVGYYENIKRFANYADFLLDKTAEEMKLHLAKQGYIIPGPLNLDFIDHDRTKQKGYHPSYAFLYNIRETPFSILCDLRNKKNEIHFLSEWECREEQAKIAKRRERSV